MTERIRVIRSPHTSKRPYFSMRRESAQDSRLTWEARGVLAYLLSKPDDWQVMIADLKQNCGRDKVRKILAELKRFGYLTIEQGRDEYGKFTGEYQVHEIPMPVTENQSPETSNRKPVTRKPVTENHPLHNTEGQSTETNTLSPNGDGEQPAKAHRTANPWYDVVKDIWGYVEALNVVMGQMLQGKAKQKGYREYNLTTPVTPEQVKCWAAWYRATELGGNPKLNMLAEPIKVQSSLVKWVEMGMPSIQKSALDGLRIVS